MAAKSKRVAAKKVPKKTPVRKSVPRPAKAKAVEAEVVVDAPDLMTRDVTMEISDVEQLLSRLEGMSNAKLLGSIKHYSERAAEHAGSAVNASALALVCAWTCGRMLNAAKAKLGRGGFGQWRDEHLVPDVMSERTSQRYMKLAESCHDVRALLDWGPSLRQAYVACGILPEPERTADERDEEEAPKTRALLTSVSGLQKNLRLFTSSGEKLSRGDRTQLQLMRDELNRFFDQILG